ncbi:MAG: hypothetical protein NVSMB10_15110 [Steroidobacteraceae bacterium]
MFDAYSRDQLRQSYADAWRKFQQGSPLSPLEALLADVIGSHPEYQTLLGDTEAALAIERDPQGARENPFLHLGLHTAVREQVSIDRPPGVRALHAQLAARLPHPHDAEHALMEALAETLWEAQRSGRAPDEAKYLERVRLRAIGD